MQDASLEVTLFKADDISTNTAGSASTIGTGEPVTGRIRIKANTVDGYWSTTEGGQKFLLTMDLNKVSFTDVVLTSVSNGSAARVATPTGHTSGDTTNNQLSISHEITSDALRNYGFVDVYFRADTVSTINPGVDSNITLKIADKEMYQNSNTGIFMIDYYNAVSNADLGESNVTGTFYIN
jgi:hypothetical protein